MPRNDARFSLPHDRSRQRVERVEKMQAADGARIAFQDRRPPIGTNDPVKRDLPGEVDLSHKPVDEVANPRRGTGVEVKAAAARHSVPRLIFDVCRYNSINGYAVGAHLLTGTKLLYDPVTHGLELSCAGRDPLRMQANINSEPRELWFQYNRSTFGPGDCIPNVADAGRIGNIHPALGCQFQKAKLAVQIPQLVERRRKDQALTGQMMTKAAHIKDFLARRKQQVDALFLNDACQCSGKFTGRKAWWWQAKGAGHRAAVARYSAGNAVRDIYGAALGSESARVVQCDRCAST